MRNVRIAGIVDAIDIYNSRQSRQLKDSPVRGLLFAVTNLVRGDVRMLVSGKN